MSLLPLSLFSLELTQALSPPLELPEAPQAGQNSRLHMSIFLL